MTGTHRHTGEKITKDFPVCAEHARELTRPCDADGCNNVAAMHTLRLPTTGDVFTFCTSCHDTLRNEGSLAVRGITLLSRDGLVMLVPPGGQPPQG